MAVRQHELAANPQDALNAYYTDIRNTAFRFLELSTSWVFISLLVVAIFSGSTRAALGVIGDVLGYWAITYHPLAGHPYRFRVLDRGVAELTKVDGALVIVGHSQGSVLALDLIGRLRVLDSDRRLSLVTCGSPLDSLYARFFPLVFTSQTSGEVQAAVGGRWTNFWRKTDPIATPIPGIPSPGNVEIAEEGRADPRHPLRAHSDYWIEPKQQAQVREYLRPDGEVT
jgi:pimeloyl-ACP methyl ester carboxylesterase